MLFIWTSDAPAKVKQKLAGVFKLWPQVPVVIGNQLPAFGQLPPKTILSMGSLGIESYQASGFIPKKRTISSCRRQVFHTPLPTMATYSCGIGEIDYGKHIDLVSDINAVMRLHETGSIEATLGNYKFVPDLNETLKAIRERAGSGACDVAVDLETIGFDPYRLPEGDHPGAFIVSIQVTYKPGQADVVAFTTKQAMLDWIDKPENKSDMAELLNAPWIRVRGANFKFDLHWIKVHFGIECTNFTFDTTLAGSSLDENRSNALDVHAKIYVPSLAGYSDQFDRSVDKSRMDLVLQATPEEFLKYAGGDTDACLQVATAMRKEILEDDSLSRFYVTILHPAARAFEQVEQGGVLVDKEAYKELEAALRTEMLQLIAKAKKIVGGRLVAKHSDEHSVGGLNLTKASFLIDFLFSPAGLNLKPKQFTEGKGLPSTAEVHLQTFRNDPEAAPFIELLKDYGSAMKTLSNYVVGFQKHIRSDGRFHSSYWLFAGNKGEGDGGTNTGRLSARDPAFQCLNGSSLVYNKEGWTEIEAIVSGYEQGKNYSVLTHTGDWKPVIGVYRNGVQPLLKITTVSGATLECTHNHPWLTDYGFVKAGKLRAGSTVWRLNERAESSAGFLSGALDCDRGFRNEYIGASDVSGSVRLRNSQRATCFRPYGDTPEQVLWLLQKGQADNAWAQPQRESVINLLELATHDFSLLQSEGRLLQGLWGQGSDSLRFLARLLREFSKRYGRETCGVILREITSEWKLQPYHLPVGYRYSTGAKSQKQHTFGNEWDNQAPEPVGCGVWDKTQHYILPASEGVEYDSSPYHAYQAGLAGFVIDHIASIEEIPAEETFDLTIEGSHSFIANGIVVHNTIPKHTKWAKLLRKCFIAPPGYMILENDYSQGELKIIACVANEDTMIEAYKKNMDLHSLTSGRFAGYSYEKMMEMKNSEDKKVVDLYEGIRQLGKAGNFGLIYGMGAEGFQDYAENGYGVKLKPGEAAAFRDGFFDAYPKLVEYHKQYKNQAHLHGVVRSPLGRPRHLPLIKSPSGGMRSQAERQAVNAPIQSALSDMMIWAIAIAVKRGWHKESPCFGMVHDAKYTYIPEDDYLKYVVREKEIMENLPFDQVGWKPQLQFTVDGKVGPSMAELKKV